MAVLARLLIDRGIIDRDGLARAIEHQVLYGGRLGTNLIELGLATEEQIAEALAVKCGIPALTLSDDDVDGNLVEKVGKDRCEQFKVFPHSVQSKTLRLLMVDPSDHVAKAELAYALPYIVRPFVVAEHRMLHLLERFCDVPPGWRYEEHGQNYFERAERLKAARRGVKQSSKSLVPIDERPLSLGDAAAQVERATTRDQVVHAAVRLALNYCKRAVFYIVRKGLVIGWDGAGADFDRSLIRAHVFPLSEPSVLRTVYDNPGPFIGQLTRTTANDMLRKTLNKRSGNVAIVPVVLEGRVVNLLYCDSGVRGDVEVEINDLVVLSQKMADAYRRIIRQRVEEGLKEAEKPQ